MGVLKQNQTHVYPDRVHLQTTRWKDASYLELVRG